MSTSMEFFVEGIHYTFAFLRNGRCVYRCTVDKALYILNGETMQKAF